MCVVQSCVGIFVCMYYVCVGQKHLFQMKKVRYRVAHG